MNRFSIPSGVKVFVLVWLFILCIPQLNESFRAPSMLDGDIVTVPFIPVKLDRLGTQFPNDPRISALQIWGKGFNPDAPSVDAVLGKQLADFDGLIRRFPHENWLRAGRLEFMMGRPIGMDFEGAPKRTKWFWGPAALHQALACALDAEKVEPDNAYFPWMEAVIRFGLEQNEAGVKALQKAAKAPHFNDYVVARDQQKLTVLSLDHPLLLEEKLLVSFGSISNSPVQMQSAAKAATQVAFAAEKRGDNQRALQICDAILRATQVSQDQVHSVIQIYSSLKIGRNLLEKIGAPNTIKSQQRDLSWEGRKAYTQALLRNFTAYAKRYQREDVAQRASDIFANAPSTYGDSYANFWNSYGLAPPWSRVLFQGNWFTWQMALLSVAFAALWLMGKALGAYASQKGIDWSGETPPSRGQMTFSTNFTIWAMVGYGALAAYFGVGFIFGSVGWVQNLDMGTNELINGNLAKSTPYAALVAWLFPILILALARDWKWTPPVITRSSSPLPFTRRENGFRIVFWALTLLTGTLTYTGGNELWDDTPFQWLVSPWLVAVCAAVASGYEIYRATRCKKLELGHIKRKSQPGRVLFLFHSLTSTAGALAVLWSLLVLTGALALWPLRATANRAIERRIEIGEVRWFAELSAKQGD